jgi:hypothetical protein
MEFTMIESLDSDKKVRESVTGIAVAWEQVAAQERPLIRPWRISSDHSFLKPSEEGDAGCGCGPID